MQPLTYRLPVTGMRMDKLKPVYIDRESGSFSRWTMVVPGIRQRIHILPGIMQLSDLPVAGDWNADGTVLKPVYIDPGSDSISRWTMVATGILQPIVYLAWDNAAE